MSEVANYSLIAILGFFTGLGTTFGGEIAKKLVSWLERVTKERRLKRSSELVKQ